MSNQYSEMDDWTDDQVAAFKEEAKAMNLDEPAFLAEAKKAARTQLVAEGDSWFDYLPGTDLIDCLIRNHGYKIRNTAKAGDTLENMIYGTAIDSDFNRVHASINTVLDHVERYKPVAFLFSGGGNDIAGDEFASYLNHKESGLPYLRTDYIDYIVGTVFKQYFTDLIQKVRERSPATHIVTHGYGHTLPTGKGVKLLFIVWTGPWVLPALAMKGITDPVEQNESVAYMINAYNDMLQELDSEQTHFHHVDLRQVIDRENDWVNELHLKNSAFARVADLLHERIQSVAIVDA